MIGAHLIGAAVGLVVSLSTVRVLNRRWLLSVARRQLGRLAPRVTLALPAPQGYPHTAEPHFDDPGPPARRRDRPPPMPMPGPPDRRLG